MVDRVRLTEPDNAAAVREALNDAAGIENAWWDDMHSGALAALDALVAERDHALSKLDEAWMGGRETVDAQLLRRAERAEADLVAVRAERDAIAGAFLAYMREQDAQSGKERPTCAVEMRCVGCGDPYDANVAGRGPRPCSCGLGCYQGTVTFTTARPERSEGAQPTTAEPLAAVVADREQLRAALHALVAWVRYGEGDESEVAELVDAALGGAGAAPPEEAEAGDDACGRRRDGGGS